MFVYRLASRLYVADNAEGARIYGGRWNRPGTPVIYTSATKALAALEVIAHNGAIPADCRITVVTIPDRLPIETVGLDDLTEGWPEGDSEAKTAEYGTLWTGSLRTSVLRVPSAAIRAEHNYILNPLHPNFGEIRFEAPDTEHIDQRLKR